MWKQLISGYFNFTKKDRRGILALIFLVLFTMAIPFFYPLVMRQKNYDHVDFERAIALLRLKQPDSSGRFKKQSFDKTSYPDYDKRSSGNRSYNQQSKGELFYFDPNSTSAADWKRLGVRDKTVATIQNYLSKGGKFYKKEDIGKIWGLHEDEIQRLMPYIKVNARSLPEDLAEKKYEKKEFKKPAYKNTVIDINTADSTAFIALPGIGSKLSQRIINFREKLGGFYRVEQVGETFGLPDSTFQKIKEWLKTSGEIRKININTATFDEMKAHPYLRYALANAIIQYRSQHGNYKSVEDIKKLMSVTEEIFNKLAPYLAVD